MPDKNERRPLEGTPQDVPAGGAEADDGNVADGSSTYNNDLRAHANSLFDEPGRAVELRALGVPGARNGIVSGYFDDPEKLAAAARELDGRANGIYITLNPVLPELLARAHNRIDYGPKATTGDTEIVHRRRLLIDVDPVRPSGISASNEERKAAFEVAREIFEYLHALGFPQPAKGDSGNGGHLIYAIDLPANDGGLVQRFLHALAFRFDTAAACIDQKVCNPARISKLYGTLACKGDSTADRPHRRSRIIGRPERLVPVPRELLEKIAAQAPPEKGTPSPRGLRDGGFDVGKYITEHSLDVASTAPWHGGRRWVLAACPFNPEHTDRSAFVVQFATGAIAAGCHHNGCAGKGWHDLRDVLEPGWRDAKPRRARPNQPITEYKPFPVEILPPVLRRFTSAASKALGCDPSFIALPLLAEIGAAIGTTRRIKLKSSWKEFAILWTVLIARSGQLKSPALDLVMRPIRTRQARAMKAYAQAMDKHLAASNYYISANREWQNKGRKTGEPPPDPPKKPVCEQLYVEDTTVEALAEVLDENRRGVLLARDELSGWFGSFNQYKATKMSDESHWLNMFGGRSLKVNRKGGDRKIIYVATAAAWITGTIQPRVYRRALGTEYFENGMAPRLLMAMPPARPRCWTDDDLDPAAEREIEQLIERLLGIPLDYWDSGQPKPVEIPLDPAAKALFVGFVNELGQEQVGLGEDLAAAWSKLEGYAARLALIVHMVRWASADPSLASADSIDAQSMASGIALSKWFCTETKRVYAVLGESDEDAATRQKLEALEAMGGTVSVRDWQHRRSFGSSEDAEADLDLLVKAVLGRWESRGPGPKGGRPSKVFVLVPKTKTPNGEHQDGVSSLSVLSLGSQTGSEIGLAGGGPGEGSDKTPCSGELGGVVSEESAAAGQILAQQTPSEVLSCGQEPPGLVLGPDGQRDPRDKTDNDKTPAGASGTGVLVSEEGDSFVQEVQDLFSAEEWEDDGGRP